MQETFVVICALSHIGFIGHEGLVMATIIARTSGGTTYKVRDCCCFIVQWNQAHFHLPGNRGWSAGVSCIGDGRVYSRRFGRAYYL